MQIPVEITYRNVEKTESINSLIHQKIDKLEQFCNYMNSCRVAVEKTHDHPSSGSPYRVRLDITVPPGHEIAVVQNPNEGNQYEPLDAVIRDAFEAARRQLIELVERQRDEVKYHPQQETGAIVSKLFPEDGYGFITTVDSGREIYFNQSSVTNNDFERLSVGTGVQFNEIESEIGSQASTVRIIDKPGESDRSDQGTDVEGL